MAVWNTLRGICLVCTGLLGAQDLGLPEARAQVREVTANEAAQTHTRLTEQSAFSPQGLLQSSHFLNAFSLLGITIFPIRNKNAVLWYYSFRQRYTHQCPRPQPHGSHLGEWEWEWPAVFEWTQNTVVCVQKPSEREDGERFWLSSLYPVSGSWGAPPSLAWFCPQGFLWAVILCFSSAWMQLTP